MPAKKTCRLGAITTTLFTSLIAPALVSIFSTAIRTDGSSRVYVKPTLPPQTAIVRPDSPPPVVKLLPPTTAHPAIASVPSHFTVSASAPRLLTWRPAD
jgi:hypothetical protein